MNRAGYLRYAVPSWWTLFWSPRPAGRIAVLSTVWSHHAKRSGYEPVSKGLGKVLPAHGMHLIPYSVSRWIAGEGLKSAYEVALAMRLSNCDHLLVIDGDFQIKLIECIRRVTSASIYAVFHQIPVVLEQRLANASPKLLDGAVCVARCQIPLVQSLAPPRKTLFVPHGVDTDYFYTRFAPCRSAQRSLRGMPLERF